MNGSEVECLRVAARQFGVLHRRQALEWLSRQQLDRRVRSKQWSFVLPQVLRVEGAPRSWHQELKALSLWAGQDYALSHRTAAALHGFRRFPAGPREVTLLRHRELPAPVVLHWTTRLPPRDLASVQGFRVTSVTRTLVDLAGIVSEADLRATVDEALNRKRTTIDRLAVALVEHASVAGVSALREIVREYQGGDGPCESELEARVFELLDRSGLPRPTRQRSITVAGRLRRLDFLFPDHDVIVEADGYATHASPMAFEKDRQRANSLTSRGFRVLQWTWRSLHDRPGELLRELKAVLDAQASRGAGLCSPAAVPNVNQPLLRRSCDLG